jgi:aspartyl-tRNA(Asn)/glutamyl-tRNA(Gln) amidotransferase subunit A
MIMADWTLSTLAEAVRSRRVSPTEITRGCLDKIKTSKLRAFVTVDDGGAMEAARKREFELERGTARGPLHGVPLAYKDLFFIEGMPASCGTRKHGYFVSERTATAVARLEAAGAVTLGKLNMTELAMGPFGDNAHHGDVQNPWLPGRSAGGSSSGSAAAVAAGLAFGALGSDTGGSIRQPAAYCGVVGLKPTYGLVSRSGAMPLSWSLDHVGPIARTVRDAALLLSVIAGHDPMDPASTARPVDDYLSQLDKPISGVRVGIPTNYYWDGLEPETELAARAAIDALGTLGAKLVDVELPDPQIINGISSLLTRAEGTASHGAFARDNPDVLQPVINARLRLGYQISAYDYLQAMRLRSRLAQEFVRDVFTRVDVIATAVAPGESPVLIDSIAGESEAVLKRMIHVTLLTRPFNGLGLPAVSVPCGFSKAGLPLALQLIGRPFGEAALLKVAHRYEQAFDWWKRRPPQ